MPKLDEYMTVTEAAEYVGVCANTLRNWGASGKLPEYRHPVNNYRLFKMSDVERLRRKIREPALRPAPTEKTRRRRPK